MIIPEINADHAEIIPAQRKRLGTKRGFIAVKSNCSIQSYVPALSALMDFEPTEVSVCTYQAISGAGKTFETWPEMVDNRDPLHRRRGGEEREGAHEGLGPRRGRPHRVGRPTPVITAQCLRVACSDGHMAAASVKFKNKPSKEVMIERWNSFKGRAQELNLPSAPEHYLTYFEEDNRPQTKLDRNLENGMGVSIGRLREDTIFDYKFVSLSHNTLRGAAGGAVLMAELLCAEGYMDR